jgi:hypothetical protein
VYLLQHSMPRQKRTTGTQQWLPPRQRCTGRQRNGGIGPSHRTTTPLVPVPIGKYGLRPRAGPGPEQGRRIIMVITMMIMPAAREVDLGIH